jgi:hypothetical protein
MFVVSRPEQGFLTDDGSTVFGLGIAIGRSAQAGAARTPERGRSMGTADKASNKIEELKGQAKEAGEKVKDVGRRAQRLVQS